MSGGYIRSFALAASIMLGHSASDLIPYEYNPQINCSVSDDKTDVFLYGTNLDLAVDHPESPFNGQTILLDFKESVTDFEGWDNVSLFVIGHCRFAMDGRYQYADAFNVSVAGTRQQLSYPVEVPMIFKTP